MSVQGAGQQIKAAVSAWEGISVRPHRFGGVEYRLGTREIGHVRRYARRHPVPNTGQERARGYCAGLTSPRPPGERVD